MISMECRSSSIDARCGSAVGEGVGSTVGSGVSSGVGTAVGSGVGSGVGTAVGSGVGSGVGTAVGTGVGVGSGAVKPNEILRLSSHKSYQPDLSGSLRWRITLFSLGNSSTQISDATSSEPMCLSSKSAGLRKVERVRMFRRMLVSSMCAILPM